MVKKKSTEKLTQKNGESMGLRTRLPAGQGEDEGEPPGLLVSGGCVLGWFLVFSDGLMEGSVCLLEERKSNGRAVEWSSIPTRRRRWVGLVGPTLSLSTPIKSFGRAHAFALSPHKKRHVRGRSRTRACCTHNNSTASILRCWRPPRPSRRLLVRRGARVIHFANPQFSQSVYGLHWLHRMKRPRAA